MRGKDLLFEWIQSWGKEDNYRDWEDFCRREKLDIMHGQDLEEFAEFCAKRLQKKVKRLRK